MSELKRHPSLTNIILDVYSGKEHARIRAEIIASKLRELIGDRITVLIGDGGQFSVEFD